MCILPLLPCHHCLLMDVRKVIANNFLIRRQNPFSTSSPLLRRSGGSRRISTGYPVDGTWVFPAAFFQPPMCKSLEQIFLLNIMNILLICHLFVISILGFLEKLVPQTVNCSTQQQHPKQYQQQPADKQQKAANDSFKKEEKGEFQYFLSYILHSSYTNCIQLLANPRGFRTQLWRSI